MFRNLRKERELIDRELEIYRQEKTNAIDRRLVDLETTCAVDTAKHEHEYHSKMEELGIDIAKLEAAKMVMENDINTYKMWLKEKDKEIERINTLLTLMIKNQPAVSINTK